MPGKYTPSRRDVVRQGAAFGSMVAAGVAIPTRFVPGVSVSQPTQPARNETIYLAGYQWGPATTFNPLAPDPAWPAHPSFVQLYEALYTFNLLSGEIEPLLAAGMPEEDAEGMTIALAEGTAFQDGEELTAGDVVYSLTLPQRQEGIRYSAISDYVSTVEVVDDATLRLAYEPERINPGMVRHLLTDIHILPRHIWEEREVDGVTGVVDTEPVGSGPYLVSVASEEQVALVRNEAYWGAGVVGMPAPRNIVHPIFDSNDAGNLALQRGEVDLSQQFVPRIWLMWEELDLLVGTWYPEEPYHVPGSISMMHVNIARPGLDNPAVRRALAHAINYEQIAEIAMSRYSVPVNPSLIIPQGAEERFFRPDAIAETGGWEYNPDEARRILEQELGATEEDGIYVLDDGTRLGPWTAICPSGWTEWMTALDLVAEGAREAGIDITTEFPEAPEVTTAVQAGEFDLALWPVAGVSAAGPWLRFHEVMDSRGVPDFGETAFRNYNRYQNDEAEQLLDRAAIAEGDELVAMYQQLDAIFRADIPTIPLMYRPLEYYEFNESVWGNFPTEDNPYAPPMHQGSGIQVLYGLEPAGE